MSEAFPVRIRLPSGEHLILRCTPGKTVQQFLEDAMSRLKDFMNAGDLQVNNLHIVTEEQTPLTSNEVLSTTPYIEYCLQSSSMPVLELSLKIQTPVVKPPPQVVQPALNIPQSPLFAPQQLAVPTDNPTSKRKSSFRVSSVLLDEKAMRATAVRQFPVQFLLPSGRTVVMTCSSDVPVSDIKEQLRNHVRGLKLTSNYVLKTPVVGYLTDEAITLGQMEYVSECRKRSTTPQLILVERSAALTKKEKLINVEIGSLVGIPIQWTQDNTEAVQFRKSMTWLRYQVAQETKGRNLDLVPRLTRTPLENPPPKVFVKLHLPLLEAGVGSRTVFVEANETAKQFGQRMFDKFYKTKFPDKTADQFVFKVCGFAEYIQGDYLFYHFEHVKTCIVKKEQFINLVYDQYEETHDELYVEDFPDPESLEDTLISYDHEEISTSAQPWDQLTCISLWEMERNFRFKFLGLENMKRVETEKQADSVNLFLTAGLYHGGELVAPLMTSTITPWAQSPRWYEWVTTNMKLCNIPRGTRICFTVWARTGIQKKDDSVDETPLGWVSFQLFDYKHELRTGAMSLNLWPDDKANPIGTCVQNNSPNATILFVEFDHYSLPVVFPTEPAKDVKDATPTADVSDGVQISMGTKASKLMGLENDMMTKVNDLINKDPLYQLNQDDKKVIWTERHNLKNKPKALSKFLQSVAWNDRNAVQLTHRLLKIWAPIDPVDALGLLDSKFSDPKVREFAVTCLENLPDDAVLDYLLQLIQVLKYEPYHDSALARFLLRRALLSRKIGHAFFWHLRSEMHVPEISERYGLLLEAYLRGCGSHRAQLTKQVTLNKELVRCANYIKGFKDTERLDVLRGELSKIHIPGKIQLALNPSIEINGLKIEKCKYMDSKKLPLWLLFQNADIRGANKYVIFKSGDDLRQDMLTLQMIKLMDKLWKSAGLDLELNAYECIATGNEEGMIEVVLNAETTANITKTAGGATAAFRADPIANWLREHNKSEEEYARAVNLFVYSCAGYCVATYVLGIGDRHNDNVMLTREGRMFHIDFGHFLGNYKKKFGIKRERAPFVFTPDFAYVMGGRDSEAFLKFVNLCCDAYNILRKHSLVFINLFAMMLSTGIPELQSGEDIWYLRDAFSLGFSDEQAREKFKNLIYSSLSTKTTQLNNAIHILAH